jgi:hypothetical protein
MPVEVDADLSGCATQESLTQDRLNSLKRKSMGGTQIIRHLGRSVVAFRARALIDLLERDGVISRPNQRSRRWKDMHELLKRGPGLQEKGAPARDSS